MFIVVHTQVLENADDALVQTYRFKDKESAIAKFNGHLEALFNQVKDNQYLKSNFSIHKYTAVVKIEDERYCIAIREEYNEH